MDQLFVYSCCFAFILFSIFPKTILECLVDTFYVMVGWLVCVFVTFVQAEQSRLRRSFLALARQMDLIFKKKLSYIMLEQFLMKYVWGMTGLVIVAWPILTGTGLKVSFPYHRHCVYASRMRGLSCYKGYQFALLYAVLTGSLVQSQV